MTDADLEDDDFEYPLLEDKGLLAYLQEAMAHPLDEYTRIMRYPWAWDYAKSMADRQEPGEGGGLIARAYGYFRNMQVKGEDGASPVDPAAHELWAALTRDVNENPSIPVPGPRRLHGRETGNMPDPLRPMAWQYTLEEFIGGKSTVFEEIDLVELQFERATRLLRTVMGSSFERTVTLHSAEIPDGSRVRIVTADEEGSRLFAELTDNPDLDPDASALFSDEEYDGPHYLRLREAPLVLLVERDAAVEVAGWFYGDILRIDETMRGQGFGRTMIMLAAGIRGGLPLAGGHTSYSEGGYRTMRSAHRELVRQALLDGEDVPDAVLADYPELASATPKP
jgi:GNAT superfamily N-acetyltransferase